MTSVNQKRPKQFVFFGFSQNVLVLSLVSFLNDIGGETIKKTIPLFLANVLGVKPAIIGLVEGVAESAPHLLQPLSGYISDRYRQRKPFVVAGQMLRSVMIVLLFATSWTQILFLRLLDRSGKGIANAPRDALIAGSTVGNHVGRSFGLARMFDNAGAFVGLVLASLIVLASQHQNVLTLASFQQIVLLAGIPLVVALALILFFVRDVVTPVKRVSLVFHDSLGQRYYLFLFLSFLFTLGNSSDAFLILKSQQVGLPLWQIFLLLAGYSLVSSLSSLPLGALSDRIGRRKLLLGGWVLYSGIYFLVARSTTPSTLVVLILLYGLYYGLTEGAARAWIADLVPVRRQGAAYGLYNMIVGVTLLPASIFAGYLWQTFSPASAFYFSSGVAAAAALGLVVLR